MQVAKLAQIKKKNKYSRRCEVGIIGAPWRAEALHTLGRLSLNLLLGLGPGVVVVDVVVVDVFGGRPARCQNLGGPGVSTKKGPMARQGQCRPIRGAGARGVASDAG